MSYDAEPCGCGADDCPDCHPELRRDKSGEPDDLSLDEYFDNDNQRWVS